MHKLKDLICPICQTRSQAFLKYKFQSFKVFFCNSCLNGFTYPVPKNMDHYYPDNYWQISGPAGRIKNWFYNLFQSRRVGWVRKYLKGGLVLDFGAGEALFAKKMKGFEVISIDTPGSAIKNPDVLKVNFLNWETRKKFDAVVFWESLEHVNEPGKYLQKSLKLLKKGSFIFVECPWSNSFESKLFAKNWFHLDPPRHLVHFSQEGIKKILKKNGFKVVSQTGVYAPEYLTPGFISGLFKFFGIDLMNIYLKKGNLLWFLPVSIILFPFAVFFESVLFLSGHSSIMLVVARREK